MSTKKLKRKQKKRLMKLFLRTVAFTLLICILMIGGLVGCYNKFIRVDGGSGTSGNGSGNKTGTTSKNINKNLAVFGVDEDGYRTDVIFVVNFDSKTNEVNLVSVPRDTKVSWSENQKDKLREDGKRVVSVSKINEMTAYGGIDNIRDYTIDHIENMLGITVDNYVIINLDTFKDIIDAIGGVDMYVPRDMYYVDNSGGLYINLKEGQQNLNGDEAEQLIRFRRYPEGDVGRVEVQQTFLKAFAEKVMSPAILTKMPDLIKVMFDSVSTDIGLMEIPQYYGYAKKFDVNNITFHIIPGEGRMESGVSYFFPDMDEMDEMIQQAFYNKPTPEELEAENAAKVAAGEVVIDKTVTMQILNGSGVVGAAGRAEADLEAQGYTVSEIGNYQQSDLTTTLIFAKDVNKAKQLEVYYPNCEIKVNAEIPYDIQIVLGTDYAK